MTMAPSSAATSLRPPRRPRPPPSSAALFLFLLLLPGSLGAEERVGSGSGAAAAAGGGGGCVRLPATLTYSQASAPSDASAILSLVGSEINRDVSGVVDVEVRWSGMELHRRVGERVVRCTVTRLAGERGEEGEGEGEEGEEGASEGAEPTFLDERGRRVTSQCFEVPFAVLDVDECSLPPDGPMAHRCHPPAACVNTPGSYECVCPSSSASSSASSSDLPPSNATAEELERHWDRLAREPRGPWELSLSSRGGGPDESSASCPDRPSTRGCCDDDAHDPEGERCRSAFRCPVDPCASSTAEREEEEACDAAATCVRAARPADRPDHRCACPPGTLGSGKPCPSSRGERGRGRGGGGRSGRSAKPEVKYDGKTPTDATRRALEAGEICGCAEPVVDACDGFPKCPGKHEACTVSSSGEPRCDCRDGYVRDPDYGCVDESPPVLALRPDPLRGLDLGDDPSAGVVRLSQGDRYEEHGVDIEDDNAEEYLRSLKIAYSRPLPRGCLLEMGSFEVTYTVATPWTDPDRVTATRTVIVDNVDECAAGRGTGAGVGADCPELAAMCDVDAGAACEDEVGTYRCECPEGTEGDGFLPIPRLRPDGRGGFAGTLVPRGYRGGTGCRDVRPPVLELRGPNPKRFRVARAGGVRGVIGKGGSGDDDEEANARDEALLAEQRSSYERDVRSLIEATDGAELCATSSKSNVRPSDCVRAEDHTFRGVVDLSTRVTIGEPVAKDDGATLSFMVPYNLVDDAGNKAETVWRDIIVEEVDLADFESRAEEIALAGKRDEVKRAVEEALAKERKEQQRNSNQNRPIAHDCPPCKPCVCSQKPHQSGGSGGTGILSSKECDKICDKKVNVAVSSAGTCARDGSGYPIIEEMVVFMEGLMGPSAMMLLLLGCTLTTTLYVIQRAFRALFLGFGGPDVRTYYHTREDYEHERIMMRNVEYYTSPAPSSNGSRQTPGSGSGSSSTTPLSSTSIPRPPPTASLSSGRRTSGGSVFVNGGAPSPQQGRGQGTYSSPFRSGDGTDNIYQSRSPITPLRTGLNGTPASSAPVER